MGLRVDVYQLQRANSKRPVHFRTQYVGDSHKAAELAYELAVENYPLPKYGVRYTGTYPKQLGNTVLKENFEFYKSVPTSGG